MTFCGYEQDEIQKQIDTINKTVEDFKNSTDDERIEQTTSLEYLMKKLDEEDEE